LSGTCVTESTENEIQGLHSARPPHARTRQYLALVANRNVWKQSAVPQQWKTAPQNDKAAARPPRELDVRTGRLRRPSTSGRSPVPFSATSTPQNDQSQRATEGALSARLPQPNRGTAPANPPPGMPGPHLIAGAGGPHIRSRAVRDTTGIPGASPRSSARGLLAAGHQRIVSGTASIAPATRPCTRQTRSALLSQSCVIFWNREAQARSGHPESGAPAAISKTRNTFSFAESPRGQHCNHRHLR